MDIQVITSGIKCVNLCYVEQNIGITHFTALCFIVLCFIALCRYCIIYTLKVCGTLALSKSIGAIFSTAFAHFVSVSHLVFLALFQTFSLLYLLW